MVEVIFEYVDTVLEFYVCILHLVGCFSMIILDTCCFECLMHVFRIFVFAPVQRN